MIRKLKYSLLLSVAVVGASASDVMVENPHSLSTKGFNFSQTEVEDTYLKNYIKGLNEAGRKAFEQNLLTNLLQQVQKNGSPSEELKGMITSYAGIAPRDEDSAHVLFKGIIDGYFIKIGDDAGEIKNLSNLKKEAFFDQTKNTLQNHGIAIAMPEYMGVLAESDFFSSAVTYTITEVAGKYTVGEVLGGKKKLKELPTTLALKEEIILTTGIAIGLIHDKGAHRDGHLNNMMLGINPLLKVSYDSFLNKGLTGNVAMKRAIEEVKFLGENPVHIGIIDIETMRAAGESDDCYEHAWREGRNEVHDVFKVLQLGHAGEQKRADRYGIISDEEIEKLDKKFFEGYFSVLAKNKAERILGLIEREKAWTIEGIVSDVVRRFHHQMYFYAGTVRENIENTFKKDLKNRKEEKTSLPKEKTKAEIKAELLAGTTTEELTLEDAKDGSEFAMIKEKKVLNKKALLKEDAQNKAKERVNNFRREEFSRVSGHAPEKKEFDPLLQSMHFSVEDKRPLSPRKIEERKDKLLEGVTTTFEESEGSDGFTVVRVKPTLNLKEALKKIEPEKDTVSESSTQDDDEEWQVLDFDEPKENLFASKIKMDASKLGTSRVNRFERAEEPVRNHAPEKTPTEPSRGFFGKVLGFFGR